MNKLKKAMWKILGIPEIKLSYAEIMAESMEDAEDKVKQMCDCGMLSGKPENWSTWTTDGKHFTVEEYVPCVEDDTPFPILFDPSELDDFVAEIEI